jgi:hypothetical protein
MPTNLMSRHQLSDFGVAVPTGRGINNLPIEYGYVRLQ